MKRPGGLQHAMWSIHSHAVRQHFFSSPRFDRALPLAEAIDTVAAAEDEHGPVRRNIVNASLRHANLEPLPEPVDKALRKAGVPNCVVQASPVVPTFDMQTDTMQFEMTSKVNRPLSEIRKILDPRGWGHCSDFFDPPRTYRIRVDGRQPARDAQGRYVREDGVEPLGDSWSGLLRERFNGPGVSVDNTLAIYFQATEKEVLVDYKLYGSESCTLGFFSDIGGLQKNSGSVKAVEEDGETVVEVTKTLSFYDYTPGDPGNFIDFGDALSMLMAVMGVALVNDKFVLKLCCDPDNVKLHPKRSR
jgi:hypothetical protein